MGTTTKSKMTFVNFFIFLSFLFTAVNSSYCKVKADGFETECCAGGDEEIPAEACSTFKCLHFLDLKGVRIEDKSLKLLTTPYVTWHYTATINLFVTVDLDPFTLPDLRDEDPRTFYYECNNIGVAKPCLVLRKESYIVNDTHCSGCYDFARSREADSYREDVGCFSIKKTARPPFAQTFTLYQPTESILLKSETNPSISNSVNNPNTPAAILLTPPTPSSSTTDDNLPIFIGIGVGVCLLCALIVLIIALILKKRAINQANNTPPALSSSNDAIANTLDVPMMSARTGSEVDNYAMFESSRDIGASSYSAPPMTTASVEYGAPPLIGSHNQCSICKNIYPTPEDLVIHTKKRHPHAETALNNQYTPPPITDLPDSAYGAIDLRHIIEHDELQMGKVLGEGSFGIVRRAVWRDIPVAVKEVKGDVGRPELISEVAKLQSLRPHKNVVEFIGVAKHPLALVVAFCAGGSLVDRLKKMDQSQKTMCAHGICLGINHLHLENIVHRDLAARNILLEDSGNEIIPKVADFGMARIVEDESGGATKSNVGPLAWMAPESISDLQYSPQSDVWSYGVVLWEMFAESKPWPGDSAAVAAHKTLSGERLPLDDSWPAVIREIMSGCWHTDPLQRIKTVTIIEKLKGH